MYRITHGKTQNLPDVSAFLETLRYSGDFFDKYSEIFVTRAPGRLDVMGGIADYSGSLVLELPIAEAALVALQKRDSSDLKIVSLGAEDNQRTLQFDMSLDEFKRGGKPISYAEANAEFRKNSANFWAAYIAGAFLVLMREKNISFTNGASILIDSKVPEGKGVSSSAAIEVAAMSAIAAAFEIEITAREIAVLCQKVENLIVGAPCGIMDQMSSACGIKNRLFSMICQPAELKTAVEIPEEIAFWGIDSGIRHSIAGADYGSVRTGAFIGHRIIADLIGLKVKKTEIKGVVEVEDARRNGYLANITPEEFEENFAAYLPDEISGEEFLSKYQGITDPITKVLPGKIYQVFNPTAHPIYENARVQKFAELLNGQTAESDLHDLGELMFASHRSYSECGLGTEETDLLVNLVKKSEKLYGAKITGGGSGGTVAILGRRNSAKAIEQVAAEYKKLTGYQPYIFKGSSPGADDFGHIKLRASV